MITKVAARGKSFERDVPEVEELFMHPEVKNITEGEMEKMLDNKCDIGGVAKFMCDKHGFSNDRLEKYINVLDKKEQQNRQSNINKWF
jgi:hypothetical protein